MEKPQAPIESVILMANLKIFPLLELGANFIFFMSVIISDACNIVVVEVTLTFMAWLQNVLAFEPSCKIQLVILTVQC